MFKGLYLDGTGWATTTNPNITGDLTVIVELWKEIWETGVKENLACVYETSGGERSWYLDIDNGSNQLEFGWSTDGAVASSFAADIPDSFKTVDFTAFKMEFDSDPGTVELFAAETEAGPWTLLGTHNIGSITTLFSSSADLIVGMLRPSDPARLLTNAVVKKVQVYSSVGTGTPVVDADFDAEARGTTTFVDNQSNTWTLNNNSAIIDGQTPNLDLHVPDPTDIAKEWAEGVAKEWNELNVESIDTYVGNKVLTEVDVSVFSENDLVDVDGSAKARYMELGDLVVMWIEIKIGGSHTIPTLGFIEISLPVTPDASFHNKSSFAGRGDTVGEGHLYDASTATERQTAIVYLDFTVGRIRVALEENQVNRNLTGDDPFIPADGDAWNFSLMYKKA